MEPSSILSSTTYSGVNTSQQYAERHAVTLVEAVNALRQQMRAVEGTLSWYSVHYWSETLQLDIGALKRDLRHLISIKPGVTKFLSWIRCNNKQLHLVTNAHRTSLELKMECTALEEKFDRVTTARDLGTAKEQCEFWQQLQRLHPFDERSTLLVADNLAVLRTARKYGIEHLYAVRFPDSMGPARESHEFHCLESLEEIMMDTL